MVGMDEDGYREVLGVWCTDLESEAIWSEVFRDLRERELTGVRYVVSDDHQGLTAANSGQYQGAFWQRCQVPFIRNILGMAPNADRGRIAALLKEITESQTEESARCRLRETVDTLPENSGTSRYLRRRDTDGVCAARQHRKRMRTTNMLKRFNEEIKRRTRVVRIFPNEQSCIRLVSAMAIEMNEAWTERMYLDMNAVEMTERGMPDIIPHSLENAPRFPHYHSTVAV